MKADIRISDDVRDVLSKAVIEGNILRLTGQLDRDLYTRTNKALEAIGGKWNRGKKGHVFDGDPRAAIEAASESGKVAHPNQLDFFPTSRARKGVGGPDGSGALAPSQRMRRRSVVNATETPIYPEALDPTSIGEPSPPSDWDRGPFVTLWTGRRWYFTRPETSDVHAADWHALAFVNRYGGAAGVYSVMEHMVRGVALAEELGLPPDICLAFGVHDCPEVAPPSDLHGPLVRHLERVDGRSTVLHVRSLANTVTWLKCGTLATMNDPAKLAIVDKLDAAMCAAEKRDLVRGWADKPVPEWAPKERIVPRSTEHVRERYLAMLRRYAPALAEEFAEGWL